MDERAPITVDVISDVVCPWCYIGQKRLARALESAPDVAVEVRWRPFQLDPTVPAEGLDRKEYMIAKFGSAERMRELNANVQQAAADDGIAFAFDAIETAPNTLDAHRLIRWAGAEGPAMQTDIVARLFSAYFEEGRNIGDRKVLSDIAHKAGMDRAIVDALLAGDADREAVSDEIATAQQMGVTGVPCFILENRYAVIGAQDAAQLVDALREVSAAKAKGELNEGV